MILELNKEMLEQTKYVSEKHLQSQEYDKLGNISAR